VGRPHGEVAVAVQPHPQALALEDGAVRTDLDLDRPVEDRGGVCVSSDEDEDERKDDAKLHRSSIQRACFRLRVDPRG
jgi:hypothetical protein